MFKKKKEKKKDIRGTSAERKKPTTNKNPTGLAQEKKFNEFLSQELWLTTASVEDRGVLGRTLPRQCSD